MNSKIILAKNIKMDRNYSNVLDYTQAQMVGLLSNSAHLVIQNDTFSFIRGNMNAINVPFSYDTCLQANYIGFQNPHYSNRWFFAWIDSIVYISDGTTRINFTIDSWSTWSDSITTSPCYVIREHVNDDTIGANTVDENLSIGEVVCEKTTKIDMSSQLYVAVATSVSLTDTRAIPFGRISVYNGQIYGYDIALFPMQPLSNLTNLLAYIRQVNEISTPENIHDMFIVPADVLNIPDLVERTFNYSGTTYHYYTMPYSEGVDGSVYHFNKLTTFNDYTPKNKKLLCYPYNYIMISNNIGSENIFKYEDFYSATADFIVDIAFSIGCSGRLYPQNYRKKLKDYDEAVPLAKYPTCSWATDAYVNWLTQNAINIPLQFTSAITGGLGGGAQNVNSLAQGQTSSQDFAISQGFGLANTMLGVQAVLGQFYKASLLPNVVSGQNIGDVAFSDKNIGFTVYQMRAKTEYLKIIDDYFSRFGYKIARVKTPNIRGRQNFNFIQIGAGEKIGYGTVPSNDYDIINRVCQAGVTIWHNHENMGNFSVANGIITN